LHLGTDFLAGPPTVKNRDDRDTNSQTPALQEFAASRFLETTGTETKKPGQKPGQFGASGGEEGTEERGPEGHRGGGGAESVPVSVPVCPGPLNEPGQLDANNHKASRDSVPVVPVFCEIPHLSEKGSPPPDQESQVGILGYPAEAGPEKRATQERRGALGKAVGFLREALAGGPRTVEEIRRGAREAGIADRTLTRAKAILGVKSRKTTGSGPWVWELDGSETPPDQECQNYQFGILGVDEGSPPSDQECQTNAFGILAKDAKTGEEPPSPTDQECQVGILAPSPTDQESQVGILGPSPADQERQVGNLDTLEAGKESSSPLDQERQTSTTAGVSKLQAYL